MQERYAPCAAVVGVYVREAHTKNHWPLGHRRSPARQPSSLDERLAAKSGGGGGEEPPKTRRVSLNFTPWRSAEAAEPRAATLHASTLLLMDVRRAPPPPPPFRAVLTRDEVREVLEACHDFEAEIKRMELESPNASPRPARLYA